MSNIIQAIRGMNDHLPSEILAWHYIEKTLQRVASHYGYQEIRLPIVESTQLFKRSIGDVTDIVEKEMYTFFDRNGDSLTLRPEGTASTVRAGIQHGLFYNQTQRLWYMGPMFRHERPQKGRYRQFYHFGAEAFGFLGPDIDVELISLSSHLWEVLNIHPYVALQINSLGSLEARAKYRTQLVDYFTTHHDQLDEDSRKRLTTNPLRILDSKNPHLKDLIENAPSLMDHLDEESKEHFFKLTGSLDILGIKYQINPRLVRGLDYYNRTVFEWVSDQLGAQSTVCAGGRYDGLVEQLGGRSTPAVGFAIGIDRLVEIYRTTQTADLQQTVDIYVIRLGENAFRQSLSLIQELRRSFPLLTVIAHCGDGSIKRQFKDADKSQAKIALILGDEEVSQRQIGIKFLRENRDQERIQQSNLIEYLSNYFK